jgi:cyclophilin family peptidyl-prolyl cis-trans isomerase/HEAT repeat protein
MCSCPRIASGLIAVALVAACGVQPVPTADPASRRTTMAAGSADRLVSLLRHEDTKAFDEEVFRLLLADVDPVVRARAALTLGRIRDPAGLYLLRHALLDPADAVRADAAFALGQMADSGAAAIAALRGALRDGISTGEARASAVEAAAALGRLRSTAAREALEVDVFAAPPCHGPGEAGPCVPSRVLVEALLAVWRLPDATRAFDHVARYAAAADDEVRWAAVYALFRSGGTDAVPVLVEALSDPVPLIRATAARGLRASLVDSAGRRAEVVAALRPALGDAHPHVRINAARAAASYRDPALRSALLGLLQDTDVNVALAAAEAAGELIDPATAPALAAVAGSGARLAVRAAAIGALLSLREPEGDRHLEALARSANWLQRHYAARLLPRARHDQVLQLAAILSRDADYRVAAATLLGLAAIPANTMPQGYALFLEGVGHPHPEVRAAALRGFELRADAADLPLLLEAYARAESDPVPHAALAAIDALAALAREGLPVARSFFVRFSRHTEAIVRVRVATGLGGEWGAPWPVVGAEGHAALARSLLVPALEGDPPPRVRIRTAGGDIVLELAPAEAPRTVANFMRLAAAGYFDGGRWHRVVPNFVLQDGDPSGSGSGGPGWTIRDELNRLRYTRGAVGMALAGPDTGGSQFFITHAPQPHLDGGYTVFGRVVEGMDVADGIVQDDVIHSIELLP